MLGGRKAHCQLTVDLMHPRQVLAEGVTAIGTWSRSRIHLASWIAVGLLAAVTAEALWLAVSVIGPNPIWDFGMDHRFYVSLGESWLMDGAFYLPHQLAAPYQVELLTFTGTGDTLYPPPALFLFVPLAMLPPSRGG